MPQDLPPSGGYEPIQYKVRWSRELSAKRSLTVLALAAQHPHPRAQTGLLPPRHGSDNGLRLAQGLRREP